MTFGSLHDETAMMHLAAEAAAFEASERCKANPFRAEIVPNCRPEWHVIVTHTNSESIAAGHLIARGFGTYLPQYQRSEIVRGRKKWRTLNIFPGYLFLFVWDIGRHWRRIESCTGVNSVLHTIEGTPLVVGDDLMDKIQAEEFNQLFHEGKITVATVATRLKRSRRGKKHRLQKWGNEIEADDAHHHVTISTKSYFSEIETLDDSGRNNLLHRALGLAS